MGVGTNFNPLGNNDPNIQQINPLGAQQTAYNKMHALQNMGMQSQGTSAGGLAQIAAALLAARAKNAYNKQYDPQGRMFTQKAPNFQDTPMSINPVNPNQNNPATVQPFMQARPQTPLQMMLNPGASPQANS